MLSLHDEEMVRPHIDINNKPITRQTIFKQTLIYSRSKSFFVETTVHASSSDEDVTILC